MREAKKAADILQSLLGGKFAGIERYALLFSSWPEVAGEVFSQYAELPCHSWIKDLKDGTLIVETDHAGWIQLLKTQEAQLLSSAQRRFADLDITSLSFRLKK